MKAPLKLGAIASSAAVFVAGAALLLWPASTPANAANAVNSVNAANTANTTAALLTVTGQYLREPANPNVAAAYFTVRNDGGREEALTSVASDSAARAEMHGEAGGKMTTLSAPRIPAHGTLVFTAGANHVMLMSPRALKAGDHVMLTLNFAHSPAVTVDAPVVAIEAPAPPS